MSDYLMGIGLGAAGAAVWGYAGYYNAKHQDGEPFDLSQFAKTVVIGSAAGAIYVIGGGDPTTWNTPVFAVAVDAIRNKIEFVLSGILKSFGAKV